MTITRRWQTGFEALSGDEFTGGRFEPIASPVRSGTYSNRLNPTSSQGFRYFYQSVSATRQVRAACAFNMAGIGSTDAEILVVRDGANQLLEITVDGGTENIRLVVDGVQQDITTDTPLAINTWFHIGIDCKIDSGAGWAYVYLNGVEILSFDGDTGNADIDAIYYGSYTLAATGGNFWYYDDCYIDDATDEGSAAVCPLIRFQWISPNATGNYDQWVGSDGNNTDNYALVDERGPSTADYVEEDTVDQFDSYTMTTYALGAGEQIDAVIPMAYAQRYGADEEIALGTRYDSTDAIGSDQDPGFGAWSYTSERQTAKPGGGAWTQATLDDVEVVLKSRGSF